MSKEYAKKRRSSSPSSTKRDARGADVMEARIESVMKRGKNWGFGYVKMGGGDSPAIGGGSTASTDKFDVTDSLRVDKDTIAEEEKRTSSTSKARRKSNSTPLVEVRRRNIDNDDDDDDLISSNKVLSYPQNSTYSTYSNSGEMTSQTSIAKQLFVSEEPSDIGLSTSVRHPKEKIIRKYTEKDEIKLTDKLAEQEALSLAAREAAYEKWRLEQQQAVLNKLDNRRHLLEESHRIAEILSQTSDTPEAIAQAITDYCYRRKSAPPSLDVYARRRGATGSSKATVTRNSIGATFARPSSAQSARLSTEKIKSEATTQSEALHESEYLRENRYLETVSPWKSTAANNAFVAKDINSMSADRQSVTRPSSGTHRLTPNFNEELSRIQSYHSRASPLTAAHWVSPGRATSPNMLYARRIREHQLRLQRAELRRSESRVPLKETFRSRRSHSADVRSTERRRSTGDIRTYSEIRQSKDRDSYAAMRPNRSISPSRRVSLDTVTSSGTGTRVLERLSEAVVSVFEDLKEVSSGLRVIKDSLSESFQRQTPNSGSRLGSTFDSVGKESSNQNLSRNIILSEERFTPNSRLSGANSGRLAGVSPAPSGSGSNKNNSQEVKTPVNPVGGIDSDVRRDQSSTPTSSSQLRSGSNSAPITEGKDVDDDLVNLIRERLRIRLSPLIEGEVGAEKS